MTARSHTSTRALVPLGLAGLGGGALLSSLLGLGVLAGFCSVALAAGAVMALNEFAPGARSLQAEAGLLTMLFPPAVVLKGEEGILWSAALALLLLGAATAMRGQRPGNLRRLAVGALAVLHLGLLGSYLLLVASEGKGLLATFIAMVAAFELAHGIATSKARPRDRGPVRKGRRTRVIQGTGSPAVDRFPPAAIAGLVACQAAAVACRPLLPSPLAFVSLVILGAAVGGGAIMGHASAAALTEDYAGRPPASSMLAELFGAVNSLLFAVGAFYYGFRLYLA